MSDVVTPAEVLELVKLAGFDSHVPQNSDRLDFRDVGVTTLSEIIRKAYAAGVADAAAYAAGRDGPPVSFPALVEAARQAGVFSLSDRDCYGMADVYKRLYARAGREYRKIMADPGDLVRKPGQPDNVNLAAGIALASAYEGRHPGCIPTIQALGVKLAALIPTIGK